jgi:hypothetical protein
MPFPRPQEHDAQGTSPMVIDVLPLFVSSLLLLLLFQPVAMWTAGKQYQTDFENDGVKQCVHT